MLILSVSTPLPATALQPQLVVKSGDSTPVGGTYASVGQASLNDSDIAFRATVDGGSSSHGIFRIDSIGVHTAVALPGDSAPGTGGGTFVGFRSPVLNASGDVAFNATVSGGTTSEGIFVVDSAGVASGRAVLGQSAPGGGMYSTFNGGFGHVSLNAAGSVAFQAAIVPFSAGIFVVDSNGTGVRRASFGDTAPGTGGGLFAGLATEPVINDAGDVAFVGAISSGISPLGVFVSNAAGDISTRALAGQIAPDTGGGRLSGMTWPFAMPDGGAVFLSDVVGGTTTHGTFLSDSLNDRSAIALAGQDAPATMGTYDRPSRPIVSASAHIVFTTRIDDVAEFLRGTFLVDPLGVHQAVMLSTQPAPGTGGGTFLGAPSASLSPSGEVLVRSAVTGGDTAQALFLFGPGTPKLPSMSWLGLFALIASFVIVGWFGLQVRKVSA